MLALERVYLYPVPHTVPQQGKPVGLTHQVLDYPMLTSHHEVPVLQVGQSLYYPVLCLRALELFPLLRLKETVPEGQLQVLTQ